MKYIFKKVGEEVYFKDYGFFKNLTTGECVDTLYTDCPSEAWVERCSVNCKADIEDFKLDGFEVISVTNKTRTDVRYAAIEELLEDVANEGINIQITMDIGELPSIRYVNQKMGMGRVDKLTLCECLIEVLERSNCLWC